MDKLADNPFLDADLGPDVPLLQREILSLAEVRELHQEVIDSFLKAPQETLGTDAVNSDLAHEA